MRQLEPFNEGPSELLSRDILALDRQQCRLMIRLLTGHYTLKQHLNIMGFFVIQMLLKTKSECFGN
jgi:hypothetical protein